MEALKKKIFRELDEQIDDFSEQFNQVFSSQDQKQYKSNCINAILDFLYDTDILTADEIEPYDDKLSNLTEKIYK